jgi:hypothetical protein
VWYKIKNQLKISSKKRGKTTFTTFFTITNDFYFSHGIFFAVPWWQCVSRVSGQEYSTDFGEFLGTFWSFWAK